MPIRPKRPCNKPGCRNLTTERYCEEHAKLYQQQQDRERGTAYQRGYNNRWRKARETYLKRNPLCRHCEDEGIVKAATVVDHIVPHRGDQKLFWDRDNWQPLCKQHHDRKTVREDGGFGR